MGSEAEARERWIIHVDMDAFYAAIEQLDKPELRGKPVIVGGLGPRGVVSTASYEARRYGVHSAMPMARARKLCPHAVFLPPRFTRYREVSEQVLKILLHYTPLVEPLSLDEAFLDVSNVQELFGRAEEIARRIKREIRQKTGLTCSVGVAPNKFLAKLASDLKKPDGLVVVRHGEVLSFLEGLPVTRIWGVGEATAQRLQGMGIKTIGELRRVPLERLLREFGRFGWTLHRLARGRDDRPVVPFHEPKSLGHEETFAEDLRDPAELEGVLFRLVETTAERLRKLGYRGRTVQLKLRTPDFTTHTRATTLATPTDQTATLWEAAQALLKAFLSEQRERDFLGLRLLGFRVSGLVRGPGLKGAQLPLFPEPGSAAERKQAELERVIDELRRRFGPDALKWGRALES